METKIYEYAEKIGKPATSWGSTEITGFYRWMEKAELV
jgi:hypothetical protein